MRSGRRLLWSLMILTAAICLAVLAFLFLSRPWEQLEPRLRRALNDRLPVVVDFDGLRPFLRGGPGLAVDRLRVFAGKEKGDVGETIFAAERVTVRPLLRDLGERTLGVAIEVDSPRLRLDAAAAAFVQPPTVPGPTLQGPPGEGTRETGQPEGGPSLLRLPGGVSLVDAEVTVRDGTVEQESCAVPPGRCPVGLSVTGIGASLRVDGDRSFGVDVTGALLTWKGLEGKGPRVSAALFGRVEGSAGHPERLLGKGRIQLHGLTVGQGDRVLRFPGALQVLGRVEGGAGPAYTFSHLHLSGPGLDLSLQATVDLGDPRGPGLRLREVEGGLSDWEPLRALLAPEVSLSGRLTLRADRIEVAPGPIRLVPSLPPGSFLPTLPSGIRSEGLRIGFTAGHLAVEAGGRGPFVAEGIEMSLEQEEATTWVAKVDLEGVRIPPPSAGDSASLPSHPSEKEGLGIDAGAPEGGPEQTISTGSTVAEEDRGEGLGEQGPETNETRAGTTDGAGPSIPGPGETPASVPPREPPKIDEPGPPEKTRSPDLPRYSGPLSVRAKWSGTGGTASLVLVVDLSEGGLRYGSLLDKPAGVPLQAGLRARVSREEIRIGRAFLDLGETKWNLSGRLQDPTDPFLALEASSNILALESLAAVSPAFAVRGTKGEIAIRELTLAGRLRDPADTAVVKLRLAGRNLAYHEVPIRGTHLQAVYGKRILTVSPLVIRPQQGMIEAVFSADLSEALLHEGRKQYYGTLKIDHVEIDDLAALVSPEYAGKVRGEADVNLAFRGSGFSWPGAAEALEAKARIHLGHLVIPGTEEEEPYDGLPRRIARFLRKITGGKEPTPVKKGQVRASQRGALDENRVSGLLTLEGGRIRTENLVALYQGKLIQLQGSLDLDGNLEVELGKLFVGGRMIPFRLECRLGREPCSPKPHLAEMGRCAAEELSQGIQMLSEGAAGVFTDLLF